MKLRTQTDMGDVAASRSRRRLRSEASKIRVAVRALTNSGWLLRRGADPGAGKLGIWNAHVQELVEVPCGALPEYLRIWLAVHLCKPISPIMSIQSSLTN